MHVLRAGLHWHKGVHHEHRTPSWPFWTFARHTNLQIHTSVKVQRVTVFGVKSCMLYNACCAHQQLWHCEIIDAGDASARHANAYHHPAAHNLKQAENRHDWSQKQSNSENLTSATEKWWQSACFPASPQLLWGEAEEQLQTEVYDTWVILDIIFKMSTLKLLTAGKSVCV